MTEENTLINNIKFCLCGCGQEVTARYYDSKKHRYVESQFKHGHNNKGSGNTQWKDGRKLENGYWFIWVPDHPFADKNGYVQEHRLRMEEYLDRYLTKREVVHHLDLNKENNRIGNLMLFANNGEHRRYELWGVKRGKMVDTSNRFCLLCKGKTHVYKNGREHWYKYKNGFICTNCCQKKNRKKKKKKNIQSFDLFL